MSRRPPTSNEIRLNLHRDFRLIYWRARTWHPTGKKRTNRKTGHASVEYSHGGERAWLDLVTGEVASE